MSEGPYYSVQVFDPITGKWRCLRFLKPKSEHYSSLSPWGQTERFRKKIDGLKEKIFEKDARIASLSRENRRLRVIIAVLLILLLHLLLR